nr:hypothetical protein [Tanacetum cinerariifolium]
VYQNFLREFWCTAIAYDPNPLENNSEARPLKEYLIKFSVMNNKKPLIIDYKTIVESTRLDYAKGKYVSHPSTKEVKAKLAKIVDNPILLDRNLVLKIAFLMAWRILFTFVVQVHGVPDPQDPERNIQLAGTGLPSTLDEGTLKSRFLPEGTKSDPKDSVGNKQPIDTGLPSMVSDKGAAKTMPLPEGPLGDKDSEGNKTPDDMEPINPTVADLLGTGAKYQDELTQESDDDVLEAGEDMDEDTQADEEEYHKVSRVLFNMLTEDQWEKHEEAAVSYADLQASIEGYYKENVDHREQTAKLVQDAFKDDPTLNKKVIDASETYTKNSTALTELLILVKNFDFQGLKSTVESIQATALRQDEYLSSWAKLSKVSPQPLQAMCHKQHLLSLKGQQMLREENVTHVDTEEPPSHTKREHVAMEDDTEKTKEGKCIATDEQLESLPKLVKASSVVRPNSDAPILVPYTINGKLFYLTEEQILAHMDKEDQIKKAEKEAKRLAMTKNEVIKIVQEEAKKIGIDPKKVISAKAGEKFKKAQDAEMQVHKRQHTEKVKRLSELNKKIVEQYKWTISNRLKPEPITDVKIHPNFKPTVLNVYRNSDKRNFVVHNPFKFADFRLIELDELGPIIEKKKNFIVKDLMKSLSKIYEIMKKIPEELGIQSALPALVLEQASS